MASSKRQASRDAAQIERVSIEALVPYAANERVHSDAQVEQIAASIQEFGFVAPVLVDKAGALVAGHGRLLAAKRLGLADVPAIRLGHLTDAQARAYRIADNQLALNATWDEALLAAEVARLSAEGFDTAVLGFDERAMARLVEFGGNDGVGEADADSPVPPSSPVTKAGDIWILGHHRIICGDSTDGDAVEALLAGAKPNLMVTDPPYGVDYDPDWRNRADWANGKPYGARAVGLVSNDHSSDWREAWALFPGDVAYIWHAGAHATSVDNSLAAAGFVIRSQILWAKQQLVIGRGDYHWQHEPCWYAVRKGGKGHWAGDRKQTTLWQIDKPRKSETGHSTQKPVECMKRPMENNSRPGDAVYDPFSGSGTTIIAGEMIGRRVYAIELNPTYVDVAVMRWQEFTGLKATHLKTGLPFDQTKAA